MEKYGFIYLWFDKKRKMFYIGSHWGTESDGYICSSNRMRDAYRRRPDDFRRRILSRIYSNRMDLLEEEYRWLSKIKVEELGKRYYNLNKHQFGHWATVDGDRLSIGQKIAKTKVGKKRKPFSEETKEKLRIARAKQASPSLGKMMSEETKVKLRKPKPPRSKEHKENMSRAKKGCTPWNKGKILKPNSDKYSTKYMREYRNK